MARLTDNAYVSPSSSGVAGGLSVVEDKETLTISPFESQQIAPSIADDEEIEPSPPIPPEPRAISWNHTTPTASLLNWESIRVLVQHHLDNEGINHIHEFPIRQEERRGLLRLFGRGEGRDGGQVDRGSSLGQDTDGCEASSDAGTSIADWGVIGDPTRPGTASGEGTVATPNLDFSETAVWKYVKSYEENIQNMHPLIIPRELHEMIRRLLDHARNSTSPAQTAQSATGLKRKRRTSDLEGVEPTAASPKSPEPFIWRSVQSALALLVLALGEICLWKGKIPEPVPVGRAGRDGKTYVLKNADVIPGLNYFAIATDILGGQLAGTTLQHIHASMLASLYYGQLGRVIESHACISRASYVLEIRITP